MNTTNTQKRTWRAVGTALALSIFLAPAWLQAAPEINKAAPDFAVKDSNGKEQKLSDYKGKIVVLEWMNYGCPFIKKHYDSGNMQALQAKYTGKGVVWLSICSSAPGKQGYYEPEAFNKAAAEQKDKSSAILLDGDGTVGKLYGAKTTPHMFIVNAEGNLVYNGAIDDKRTPDPADIPSAKNYVVEGLDALLAGKPVPTATTQPYGCSVKYAN